MVRVEGVLKRMAVEPKHDGVDDEVTDPALSFDSLLRRAAYVTTVGVQSYRSRLFPAGHTLLGGRLHVQRRIGEGGMGVVYEAYDALRRAPVALKTLSRLDAQGIYRMKQEFRSLVDVTHVNLCRLHELFSENEWFFTMELVAGEPFDRWVRPRGTLDEVRLRTVLPQLAAAIAAIHRAGKLHRDLKPPNVLVTNEGRVVVLDFGLTVDRELGGIGQTLRDEGVSGTPAYMAPEQAAGAEATPASDFYALGAMLFEALTGQLPFEGTSGAILLAKQFQEPPSVQSLASHAPLDLAILCDALLGRDPSGRPDAASLQAKLGSPSLSIAPPADADERELLVGRESELAQLRSAYEATLSQRAVVLFVAGESGMGKTALVAQFLDDLRSASPAAVLTGRCYERESVPFKAFDSVVDDISRYLRRLPREESAALVPRDAFALARLFPVLERVATVADAPRRDIPDLQELQQRAFAAFRELLGRIRDRRPLVVFIDDLQWTDRDSSVFMEYLLADAEPSPLLLIASHRSENAGDNPLLQQALRSAQKNARIECRQIAVGALPAGATRQLAERMLGHAAHEEAVAIVEEAQGSPFFVGELVRHARVTGPLMQKLTLGEAVLRHVQGLPAAARALLEVLAVAGRPLQLQLALDASSTSHDAIDRLLSERLLRSSRAGGAERLLECYHDKIRELVAAALEPADLRGLHRRLAEQLVLHAVADPEHLALHYHGAGETQLAAVHYERAGDASTAALAFEYAVRQYEQACALRSGEDESSLRELHVKLAAVLAAAGRSRDAANLYRETAQNAPAAVALELRREAARLFMVSGYADQGRVLLGEVLRAIDLSLPSSRRGAIAAALWSRARLKLRGLTFHEPRAQTRASEVEPQLGALWTVVQGAIGTDPFLMVEMSARYARIALDSGSPGHAARALATEAYLQSFDGASSRLRALDLVARAKTLAEPLSDPAVLGFVRQIEGGVLVDLGSFDEGRTALARGLSWLQERCTAVSFELAAVRIYDQIAAHHLGAFAEISETTPSLMEDALRRGDMWFATMFGTAWAVPAWLSLRGVEDARRRFEEVKSRYQPQFSYQWPDFFILLAEQNLALYEGDARRGLQLATEQRTGLEQAQLMRLHMARGCLLYTRGGCALAALRQSKHGGSAERAMVLADLKYLRATDVPNAAAWASVLEGGLALHERKPEVACDRLRAAVGGFESAGLQLYAAAAQRRLGQLQGGRDGEALSARAEAAMRAQGVRDLESTTEMLTPGCRP